MSLRIKVLEESTLEQVKQINQSVLYSGTIKYSCRTEKRTNWAVAAHTFNSSTWKGRQREVNLLSLGQPGLQSKRQDKSTKLWRNPASKNERERENKRKRARY